MPFWKKKRFITIGTLTAAMFLLNFSVNKPAESYQVIAIRNAIEFEDQVNRLNQSGKNFRMGLISPADLKVVFAQTRHAYKRIEFLVAYYYPQFEEDHINGAPLLHIERHSTRPYVNPPEGLQLLDDLIFSDRIEAEKVEISNLCQTLLNKTAVLTAGFKELEITDPEVIDAIAREQIRIFTLGLTGFDTPGSLNAIAEAKTAYTAMQEAVENIQISNKKEIRRIFQSAGEYLNRPVEFDTFDRLEFLKLFVNPLYKEMQLLKQELKYSGGSVSALNPEATNIFSNDFLDPYSFTELTKEEDSPALRKLGEKLFYDPILSHDNKMSCASCHNPSFAFTDREIKSTGNITGSTLQRNAPTLLNAVYADRFFYDLRAFTLEQQAEHVIFNHNEFNSAYEEILPKLIGNREYGELFKEVTGLGKITREGFSKALASYVLSLRTFNSEFDKYVRDEIDTIDPKTILGFNIFMGKAGCGTCHFPPTFSGLIPPLYIKNESEILGVLKNPKTWKKEQDPDMGRYDNKIYSERADIYQHSFKTPGIRNVELTEPYFHNGAYDNLEAVVNFYEMGGGRGFGLEVNNQTLPEDQLNLTADEKSALVVFMKSLTDTSLVVH